MAKSLKNKWVSGHDGLPAESICNPTNAPTHVRGAALDLIIASPGVVNDVQVHNAYHCACTDPFLCCPLLGSDHFAVTASLNKSNVVPARSLKPNQLVFVIGRDSSKISANSSKNGQPVSGTNHNVGSVPPKLITGQA